MDWFEPKDKNCVAVGSGNSAGLFRLISMLDVSFNYSKEKEKIAFIAKQIGDCFLQLFVAEIG